MNLIFGLLNLEGTALDPAAWAAMQSGLAFYSPQASAIWSDGPLGLGCLALERSGSPPTGQAGVCHSPGGLSLVAGAHLSNRASLLEELELDDTAGSLTGGEIVLQAYQRWGEACLMHLEGDWHFALWDASARRLFLARDPLGNTGLYYYLGPHYFAFASTKKALLALPGVPQEPDLLRVAQVLAAWPGDGTLSSYAHIRRLPPAHHLTVTPPNARIERYWFPERIAPLRLKSDGDYVAAFLEQFSRAVSGCLPAQAQTGILLSGGLDSGSLAAMAARLLRSRGQGLLAFTSTPLSDPGAFTPSERFGDETALSQASARQAGIQEHVLVDAQSITPLEGLQRMLAVHDEPLHAAGNQFWIVALLQAARERRVDVLLTGQMGNAVISWQGAWRNLLPLLASGRPGAFFSAFREARAQAGLSLTRALRSFVLTPLLAPTWIRLQPRLPGSRPYWSAYSALRPDFARSIHLDQLLAQAGYPVVPALLEPIQQRLAVIGAGRSVLGAQWLEKGCAYGLEVRDPTQDRRLVEFCLAIPEDQFQRHGQDRWLIRRAMQGYLPDAVRLNTRRGLQAADLAARLLASRRELEDALHDLQRHPLAAQVLDLPRIASALDALNNKPNPRNFFAASTVLLRGLMAGLFLLRF